MTVQMLKKIRGRTPQYDATLQTDRILYLPRITHEKYFSQYHWVQLGFNLERREIIIKRGKRTPTSAAIIFHRRNYSIRCAGILRETGTTSISKKVSGNFRKRGKTLYFKIE